MSNLPVRPRIVTAFSCALNQDGLVEELIASVETALGGPDRVGGGLLLATAAAGSDGPAVGAQLAVRWPEANLAGTSFDGILANGRVWRDQPAMVLLAWPLANHREGEPCPVLIDGSLVSSVGSETPADSTRADELESLLLDAMGTSVIRSEDHLYFFPDALSSSGVAEVLNGAATALGHPVVAGAAASGHEGSPAEAWAGNEAEPGATLAIFVPREPSPPSEAAATDRRVQVASASRFASPWLEISACRSRWIDGLDGEPPTEWIRRQLGLAEEELLEPYLDRLLVRLRDSSGLSIENESGDLDESADDFVERYVVGIDSRRGSISVPGIVRRGGELAFALPDADRGRTEIRAAVKALPSSDLIFQFACRARDEGLHGDGDLEPALVAHEARDRTVVGTVAPFQLAPDSEGRCRLLVHATVLASF